MTLTVLHYISETDSHEHAGGCWQNGSLRYNAICSDTWIARHPNGTRYVIVKPCRRSRCGYWLLELSYFSSVLYSVSSLFACFEVVDCIPDKKLSWETAWCSILFRNVVHKKHKNCPVFDIICVCVLVVYILYTSIMFLFWLSIIFSDHEWPSSYNEGHKFLSNGFFYKHYMLQLSAWIAKDRSRSFDGTAGACG